MALLSVSQQIQKLRIQSTVIVQPFLFFSSSPMHLTCIIKCLGMQIFPSKNNPNRMWNMLEKQYFEFIVNLIAN